MHWTWDVVLAITGMSASTFFMWLPVFMVAAAAAWVLVELWGEQKRR